MSRLYECNAVGESLVITICASNCELLNVRGGAFLKGTCQVTSVSVTRSVNLVIIIDPLIANFETCVVVRSLGVRVSRLCMCKTR